MAPFGRNRPSVTITFGSPPKTNSPNPMRKYVMPNVAMKRMMSG